jgi:hypothetical protein
MSPLDEWLFEAFSRHRTEQIVVKGNGQPKGIHDILVRRMVAQSAWQAPNSCASGRAIAGRGRPSTMGTRLDGRSEDWANWLDATTPWLHIQHRSRNRLRLPTARNQMNCPQSPESTDD